MNIVRIAWFSPFPPVRTGIAGRSAEVVAALSRRGYRIDPYPGERAHEFPWRRRQEPYDLAVYQFGNSSLHDYEWPYALQYPGLTVLHDTHLHHARATLLLRERRAGDYRAEFAWSHPQAAPGAAEIAIAGLDSALYYSWPMVRSLVACSRLVAVHGEGTRQELVEHVEMPDQIVSIRLGAGEILVPEREAAARRRVRALYGIDPDAVVFICAGGITPEKRVPQVLAALAATLPHAPSAHLLLVGAPAKHYDAGANAAALGLGLGLGARVTMTGYLESDDDLLDHLAASDVSLNLRWPTARETSGPWLLALAAGVPTIVTDLVHQNGFTSLDPRTWIPSSTLPPICVSIDLLDEDHSLRLAMRRLAADADLRRELGRAGRDYWRREHTVDGMADDYERVMRQAAARPDPVVSLPAHMRPRGDGTLEALLRPFGMESPL
jgi:glycosyltransferase involved in cell wall biosynthesis